MIFALRTGREARNAGFPAFCFAGEGVKKPVRPKRGTLAAKMLAMLEACFPAGMPVGALAKELYGEDTHENRDRVRNLARTLRAWGYRAYGFGGTYKLCADPYELLLVFQRGIRISRGFVVSTDEAASGIGELGEPGIAAEARRQLRRMLLELASGGEA